MDSIEILSQAGHKELFVVVNKWDVLRRDRDKEAVLSRAQDVLPKLTERAEPVHYVSAENALFSRIEGDERALRESGFLELEKELHHFLVTERGQLRLLGESMSYSISLRTRRT